MKAVRNILTIAVFSSFLFACEADQDVLTDDTNIEDIESIDGGEDVLLDPERPSPN